jgi:hypothetical protein
MSNLTGGWVNANTFFGGSFTDSSGFWGGIRRTGHFYLNMDDEGVVGSHINQNNWYGTSFEGDVPEAFFRLNGCTQNKWDGCRFEQGTLPVAVTVSGDTITKVAHGLVVGDMITPYASGSYPGGMALAYSPYYVVSVPTADTFKISQQKGGTAFTFTTAGSGVAYYRPPRIIIDSTAPAQNFQNVISNPQANLQLFDFVEIGAVGGGGNVLTSARETMFDITTTDSPIITIRDRSGGAKQPSIALYQAAINPLEDRLNWNVALSQRGLLFADTRVEQVRFFSTNNGSLRTRKNLDSINYEIFQGLRSQGGPVSITALACAAGVTTTTTLTLTGATTGDHAIVTFTTDLPTGLILAWTRVSTTNTVKIGFYNATGSNIDLTTTAAIAVIRQYF